MRLVSWNCKAAFHRKHHLVCELKPDILIVPECEKLEVSSLDFGVLSNRSFEWIGNNPKKGIAIYSFGNYQFEVLPIFNPNHRWVIPLKVTGAKSFILLAVWTMPNRETRSYVQPLFDALEEYRENIDSNGIYIMGDFNANFIFDRSIDTPRAEATGIPDSALRQAQRPRDNLPDRPLSTGQRSNSPQA